MKSKSLVSKIYRFFCFASISILLSISGCVEPSMMKDPPPSVDKPEIIEEKIEQETIKKEKPDNVSSVKKADKKSEKFNLKKNENLNIITKIKQQTSELGFEKLKNPSKTKEAASLLELIEQDNLAYDNYSLAFFMVKKAQLLHNLGRTMDAQEVLSKNWQRIVQVDGQMKKKGELHLAPSVEAYYLQGNIALELAQRTKDKKKSYDYCKKAIKSYYAVLSLYDAKKCPFTLNAVKGFQSGRSFLKKRFRKKVDYPPEF